MTPGVLAGDFLALDVFERAFDEVEVEDETRVVLRRFVAEGVFTVLELPWEEAGETVFGLRVDFRFVRLRRLLNMQYSIE